MSLRGKLIIIEGVDGSGKTTQTKLLIQRLKRNGYKVKSLHFPQHGHEIFGKLVDAYLADEFGPAVKLDYRLAATLYAADRFEARTKIEKWLERGNWVVLDRYAESNFGHQGGKIGRASKRSRVINWLYDLDYKVFRNPHPDLVIFLDLPAKLSQNLIKQRRQGKDGHEKDFNFLLNSRRAYLQAKDMYDYWSTVNCLEKGRLLDAAAVHCRLWSIIKHKFGRRFKFTL